MTEQQSSRRVSRKSQTLLGQRASVVSKIKELFSRYALRYNAITRNAKGFTLVEIAIVLVIIGILLGGVLKGAQMIDNAKLKRQINDINGLTAAIYSYYDKYSYFPGDDPAAATKLLATGCTGAQIANGNGNGQIGGGEYRRAPSHLACAGFISGSYNGTTNVMNHHYGGSMYIFYQTISGRTGNLIRLDGLPADVAQLLDLSLDDGVYNTGRFRATAAYAAGTTIGQSGYFF